jgi:hypothetical protein
MLQSRCHFLSVCCLIQLHVFNCLIKFFGIEVAHFHGVPSPWDIGVECSKVGGRTNVHNEEQSGWPSVMSDDFVQSVTQKFCERHLTISKLVWHFMHCSVGDNHRLGCCKFCARRVPKILRVCTTCKEWLRIWLFKAMPQRWQWISQSHHGQVAGDEIWFSFLNVESKEQWKQ